MIPVTFVRNLIGTLAVSSTACLAAAVVRAEYVPPENASAPSASNTTTTGVRRGCLSSGDATLTALAPSDHVGQTLSTSPRLYWFVPDADPFPVEFRVFAVNSQDNREMLHSTAMQSTPGLMSVDLSDSGVELEVGQRYLWQVIMFCNPNRPSSAILSEAELEVVGELAVLSEQSAADSDPVVSAQQFAEAGLWYDAFTLASSTSTEPTAPNLKRITLLQQLARFDAERFGPIVEALSTDTLDKPN